MTIPVHWYRHDMGGAPVLRGVAGDLIALLDACLVNGFNLRNPTSVVVASQVATVTFASPFGWLANQVIEIAGATPAALNGEKRVSTVVGNTITFAAPGVADQTATGTITCRTPGLGWQKAFASGNVAVYRSQDVSGTRMFLRVDDSGTGAATYARVRGFETMSDVNTGTGPFPTDAQVSGGLYWPKSSAADTTTRQWALVGDPVVFYAAMRASTGGTNGSNEWGFGDFNSMMSADAYRVFLNGGPDANINSGSDRGLIAGTNTQTSVYHPRGSSQLGGSVAAAATNDGFGALEFPNQPNNGLVVRPRVLLETASRARGVARGMLASCHGSTTNNVFALGQVLSSADGYNGLAICIDAGAQSTARLGAVFDLVGPW